MQQVNGSKLTVQQLNEITSQRFASIESAIMTMAATVESFKPTIASLTTRLEEQTINESKAVPDHPTEQRLAELKADVAHHDTVLPDLSIYSREQLKLIYSRAGRLLQETKPAEAASSHSAATPAKHEKKAKPQQFQVVRSDGKKCGRQWPSMADAQAWMNGWVGNMKGATYSIQTADRRAFGLHIWRCPIHGRLRLFTQGYNDDA